mmetsp:Transcript_51059/g.95541  ORF Transcript_51059/g.95541 Transcript_51059/m.95541 type:complete len:237 (-) Transcript_51059:82-792(-)
MAALLAALRRVHALSNCHQLPLLRQVGADPAERACIRERHFAFGAGSATKRCFSAGARDPRDIVGVPLRCTVAELKAAYKKKAKELHPDLHPDDREAASARFQELEGAYRTLLAELTGTGPKHTRASPGASVWPKGTSSESAARSAEREAARADFEKQQIKIWWLDGDNWKKIGQGSALVILAMVAASAYSSRLDRLQEEEDERVFAEKRYRMRQERAERAQRELEESLEKQRYRR